VEAFKRANRGDQPRGHRRSWKRAAASRQASPVRLSSPGVA
jgi:hypothetical protein